MQTDELEVKQWKTRRKLELCHRVPHWLSARQLDIRQETSIGMFIGIPPGPGAEEIRPAISYARSGVATSTIQ